MPEFTNEQYGLRFTLPDRPTVLELATYDSRRIELAGQPAFVVLWECAKTLIREWSCPDFPDCKVDLAKIDDPERAPKIARILESVGTTASTWRRSLDEVPKN